MQSAVAENRLPFLKFPSHHTTWKPLIPCPPPSGRCLQEDLVQKALSQPAGCVCTRGAAAAPLLRAPLPFPHRQRSLRALRARAFISPPPCREGGGEPRGAAGGSGRVLWGCVLWGVVCVWGDPGRLLRRARGAQPRRHHTLGGRRLPPGPRLASAPGGRSAPRRSARPPPPFSPLPAAPGAGVESRRDPGASPRSPPGPPERLRSRRREAAELPGGSFPGSGRQEGRSRGGTR